jgi:hypothetical protein
MSLEWEWPKTWDPVFVGDLQLRIQNLIREAMSKHTSAQLRGAVVVDELNLGSQPPEIALKEILHASATTTKMELLVRYKGDASITLKGLEINLDSTSTATPEFEDLGRGNPTAAFFCPFEMTMHSIHLEGCIVVEWRQHLVKVSKRTPLGKGAEAEQRPLLPMHALQHAGAGISTPSRNAFPSKTLQEMLNQSPPRGAGVGILLSGGGRSRMRPPRSQEDDAMLFQAAQSGNRSGGISHSPSFAGGPSHPSAAASSSRGPTFYELATEQVACTSRRIRIQCADDPLKGFSIRSNFDSLAQGRVEETLRQVLRPVIDYLKTQGLVINLPVSKPSGSDPSPPHQRESSGVDRHVS